MRKPVAILLVMLCALPVAAAEPVPAAALPSARAESLRRTTSLTMKLTAGASAAAALGIWYAAIREDDAGASGANATAQMALLPGAVFVAATLAALGLDGTF